MVGFMSDMGEECHLCGCRVWKNNRSCSTNEEAGRCKHNRFVHDTVRRVRVYRGVSPAGGSEESRQAIYGNMLGSQTRCLSEREAEERHHNEPHRGDYIFVTETEFTGDGKRSWHGLVEDEDEEFVILANLYAGPTTLLFRKNGLRMTQGREEKAGMVYKTYEGQPVQ